MKKCMRGDWLMGLQWLTQSYKPVSGGKDMQKSQRRKNCRRICRIFFFHAEKDGRWVGLGCIPRWECRALLGLENSTTVGKETFDVLQFGAFHNISPPKKNMGQQLEKKHRWKDTETSGVLEKLGNLLTSQDIKQD